MVFKVPGQGVEGAYRKGKETYHAVVMGVSRIAGQQTGYSHRYARSRGRGRGGMSSNGRARRGSYGRGRGRGRASSARVHMSSTSRLRVAASSRNGGRFDDEVQAIARASGDEIQHLIRSTPEPVRHYLRFLQRMSLHLHISQIRCSHPTRMERDRRRRRRDAATPTLRPASAGVEDVCLWERDGRCALVIAERKLKATSKHIHTTRGREWFIQEMARHKTQASLETEAFVNERIVKVSPGIAHWSRPIVQDILRACWFLVYVTYVGHRPIDSVSECPDTYCCVQPYMSARETIVEHSGRGRRTYDVISKHPHHTVASDSPVGRALIAAATGAPVVL